MRSLPLIALCLSLAACGSGETGEQATGEGIFLGMHVERLPDLNAPRGGSRTVMLGDELTVFGGHTDGFNLIGTAEYLKDGRWHEVRMSYPHDGGFVTLMPDGRVMLGGGSAESFGIGQSWGVELYDPETHTFRPVGIMDRKRAYSSAMPMKDSSVLVAGNWYADDAIERYGPKDGFQFVKEAASQRTMPWILPATKDDVLIFGSIDTYGNDTLSMVDRLHGDAFHEPLLEEWSIYRNHSVSPEESRIGPNTWLVPALNKKDGSFGLVKVSEGVFSLLTLQEPLPVIGIGGKGIMWYYYLQTDLQGRVAWCQGYDSDGMIYFARIDYDATFNGGAASVQVYYADNPDGRFPCGEALFLGEGRFALVGGMTQDEKEDAIIAASNFFVSEEAWIFHIEPPEKAATPWYIILGIGLLLAIPAVFFFIKARKRNEDPASEADRNRQEEGEDTGGRLFGQMMALIEEKELYRQKDLRISDIAREMGSNKTYISFLMNTRSGSKFTTILNGYRIRYAQKLMLEHPEMVLEDVADEAGFSSRATFFRNFKAHTGMTPKQWLAESKKEK